MFLVFVPSLAWQIAVLFVLFITNSQYKHRRPPHLRRLLQQDWSGAARVVPRAKSASWRRRCRRRRSDQCLCDAQRPSFLPISLRLDSVPSLSWQSHSVFSMRMETEWEGGSRLAGRCRGSRTLLRRLRRCRCLHRGSRSKEHTKRRMSTGAPQQPR
jgi:hypothetical protein